MNTNFKFATLLFGLCVLAAPSVEANNDLGNSESKVEMAAEKAKKANGNVVEAAKQYMDGKTYTIVNKKAMPPQGHSKNYYVSMAPYWWPNPNTPDGMPYIRKDGQVNPECRELYTDYQVMRNMVDAVCTLAKAYKITNDDAYVKRVDEIVRVFFIDPKTKMLPNLEHGQFCPGGCTGRAAGIIESACFVGLVDALATVSDSSAWSKKADKGMKSWFTDFYNWLLTHPYGKKERNSNSNHGTHFDRQIMAYLAYLGDSKTAYEYLKSDVFPRVEEQAEPDGSQPVELGRTKSWNYAMMNLKAWMDNADFAATLGLDLWNYENHGQKYMKSMVDWYLPYLKHQKEWTWKQIVVGDLNGIKEVLSRAAAQYPESKEEYLSVSNNLTPITTTTGGIIK